MNTKTQELKLESAYAVTQLKLHIIPETPNIVWTRGSFS